MKSYSQCVRLTIVVVCTVCLSDLAVAQALSGKGNISETSGNGTVRGNEADRDEDNGGSTRNRPPALSLTPNYYGSSPRYESPSIPYTGRYHNSCNGEILITESPEEIFVYINGRSVRVKNDAELMQKYPDAYRLYAQTLGIQKRRFFERVAKWKRTLPNASQLNNANLLRGGDFRTNSSPEPSVSVVENGKKVSITRNKNGVSVSVNGKRVRANNVAQLRKKFPDAFRMYDKQLAAANGDDGQWAAR